LESCRRCGTSPGSRRQGRRRSENEEQRRPETKPERGAIWSNVDLVLWNFLGDKRRGQREETGWWLREEDWKRRVAARVSQGPRWGFCRGEKWRCRWLRADVDREEGLHVLLVSRRKTT
jgi:hypothetical protein